MSPEKYRSTDAKYKDYKGSIDNINKATLSKQILFSFYEKTDKDDADSILRLNLRNKITDNTILVTVPQGDSRMEKLLKFLEKYIDIDYGYSYNVNADNAGGLYSSGYLYKKHSLVDISRKKKKHYNMLRKAHSYIIKGFLRDIYQENLLKEIHLNQKLISGITLSNYIESDNKNGNLKKIGQNYLWTISPDDLKKVRKDLYKEPFVLVGDIMLQKYKDGLT